MSSDLPRVLVWGHSFVKRLYADLERGFHPRARSDFDLERSARVSLFGRGSRTVPKLWSYDLQVVSRCFHQSFGSFSTRSLLSEGDLCLSCYPASLAMCFQRSGRRLQ